MTVDAVFDHLWQSTLAASMLGLVALALRQADARTRYQLWFIASLKFLIPFAALASLGAQAGWQTALPSTPPEWRTTIEVVAAPFSAPRIAAAPTLVSTAEGSQLTTVAVTIWILGCATVLVVWLRRWRRLAAVVRTSTPITSGRIFDVLRRLDPSTTLPLRRSDSSFEPGVFGIFRPVLLWPRGIDDTLDDGQVEAIVAHELVHVRRMDNLTAGVHMLVEAAFWFHPLVWWVGSRLVDERERACDEEVVRLGSEPHVYAESILRTCRFSLESPLSCVSGITGSDLKKRIERIMAHRRENRSNVWANALVAAVVTGLFAAPVTIGAFKSPLPSVVRRTVAFGVVNRPQLADQVVAPSADAPVFEAASVRPAADTGRSGGSGTPGRFTGINLPLRRLIRQAYDIHDSQIVGGPDWLNSEGFDITATTGDKPPDQMRVMMQTLLRDRFKLTFHTEQRELPIYALVTARSDGRLGSGLRRIADGECPPPGARRGAPPAGAASAPPSPLNPNAQAECGQIIFGPGRLLAHGVPIDMLARSIGGLPAITAFNRIVMNDTRLEGQYDFDFRWTNEFAGRAGVPLSGGPPPAPAPGDEPALVTALQEQLGLKLDARRATVDVLVIDSVEKPSEN